MLTAGNSSFTYDDKGNTLTQTVGNVTTTYTWDYLNRMSQWAKTGETTQAYVYNADSMRVSKTLSGGTTTHFLLDGMEIAEEITGSVATAYVGPELICQISGTVRATYHQDGLGSTRAMSDGSSPVEIDQAAIYDAYGNRLQEYLDTGITGPNFAYAGQYRYYADSTGLDYLKTRYYDPATGRFISRDSVGYEADLNLYRYVYDAPTNAVDPDGRGMLDLIRCFWYFGKVHDAVRQAREEIMYDVDRCFGSEEERNRAIIKRAEEIMGKPGLVTKVMEWCAKAGIGPPTPGRGRF